MKSFAPKSNTEKLLISVVSFSFLFLMLNVLMTSHLVGDVNNVFAKSGSSGGNSGSGSGGDSGSSSSSDDGDDDEQSSNSGSSNDDDDERSSSSGSSSDNDETSSSSNSGSSRIGQPVLFDDNDNDETSEASVSSSDSREYIQNEDGTFTEVRREQKDDGEVKVRFTTFDAAGNKIQVEKYESREGEEKSRVKVYDESGEKLSDYRLETKDGKEIDLRLKEGEVVLARVNFDVEKNQLVIKSTSQDDEGNVIPGDEKDVIKISAVGENFVINRSGASVLSRFPLSVDDETGVIFVDTPAGDVTLNAMPDTIVEMVRVSDDIDQVSTVELETNEIETEGTNLEYLVTGTKSEKLLGLFNVQIPSKLVYDAETGQFLRNDMGFTTRVLDLFSF